MPRLLHDLRPDLLVLSLQLFEQMKIMKISREKGNEIILKITIDGEEIDRAGH